MEIRFLTAEDLRKALPMSLAIEAMKQAFMQFSSGDARVPLRTRIDVPTHHGVTFFMPALLESSMDMAVKIVSVFPENVRENLPTIHAAVVVLNPRTGAPIALIEGASLTAIRTGAASGAATDLLAREDARHLAIFGSGTQARTQVQAVCAVRDINRIWIYSLDQAGAKLFRDEIKQAHSKLQVVEIAPTPEIAIRDAHIICTATTSETPVFPGNLIQEGTHINAIGSFSPQMQELDAALLQRAMIVLDSQEAVLAESGDLIIPIRAGQLTPDAIYAELGEIVQGAKPGRTASDQITLFKSVGLAVQDVVSASAALRGAQQADLGILIDL